MDTKFKNAWEHVEHTYQIIKKGMHPPFWWFADLANSYEYLSELACSENNSTIRGRDDWNENIQNGLRHFMNKHEVQPMTIPLASKEQVLLSLKQIKER
jgi:hypothetical protein